MRTTKYPIAVRSFTENPTPPRPLDRRKASNQSSDEDRERSWTLKTTASTTVSNWLDTIIDNHPSDYDGGVNLSDYEWDNESLNESLNKSHNELQKITTCSNAGCCSRILRRLFRYNDKGSAEASSDVYVYTGGKGIFDQSNNHQPFAPNEVTHAIVHSDVKAIEKYAFANCKQLESIMLPEGLETIGNNAFENCDQLESIKLPEGLEIISEKAFCRCSKLKSVELPEGLKVVGKNAFEWCKHLESIKLPEGLEIISEKVFCRCKKLKSVELPEGLKVINKNAFEWCRRLKSMEFPSSLQKIEEYAFYNCTELTLLIFQEGLKMIGDRAFCGCNNLTAVDLPLSLHAISGGHDGCGNSMFAFEDCTNVTFPKLHKAQTDPVHNNTLLHQLIDTSAPFHIVEAFLKSCPNVVHQRNSFGQTPLHLCMNNLSDVETTKAIYKLCPGAKHIKNQIGMTPLEIWKEKGSKRDLGGIVFDSGPMDVPKSTTPFVLKDQQLVPYESDPVMLRSHYLLFEIPDNDEDFINCTYKLSEVSLRDRLNDQVQARQKLFQELLKEFALLLQFQDTVAIQQAAALEALLPKCGRDTFGTVNFRAADSSAFWYQQEILKLVLCVYREDQAWGLLDKDEDYFAPSSFNAAEKCKRDLEELAPHQKNPSVSEHRKNSFLAFTEWIVRALPKDQYKLEGPDLKPLQSLFNKLYIRRGQTKVNIVGDMTRATLHIKDRRCLEIVISRIKAQFPAIMEGAMDLDKAGVLSFLHKIFGTEHIDVSEFKIIPYRLKINSSQNDRTDKGEIPLLYNLNFFDCVPEYHRVGNTEMLVAFELQIDLEDEINKQRKDHRAYERRRILQSQPLLKNYVKTEAIKKKENEKKKSNDCMQASSSLSPTTTIALKAVDVNENFKRISAVLEGAFATHNLRKLQDMEMETSKSWKSPKSDPDSVPDLICCNCLDKLQTIDKLCLNNKRINMWAKQGKAFILDRVSLPDSACHYCVESAFVKIYPFRELSDGCGIYFGLFAHFGPYIVSIASRYCEDNEDGVLIKPGVNVETLERISPLPPGCDSVLLIVWGEPKHDEVFDDLNCDLGYSDCALDGTPFNSDCNSDRNFGITKD